MNSSRWRSVDLNRMIQWSGVSRVVHKYHHVVWISVLHLKEPLRFNQFRKPVEIVSSHLTMIGAQTANVRFAYIG